MSEEMVFFNIERFQAWGGLGISHFLLRYYQLEWAEGLSKNWEDLKMESVNANSVLKQKWPACKLDVFFIATLILASDHLIWTIFGNELLN